MSEETEVVETPETPEAETLATPEPEASAEDAAMAAFDKGLEEAAKIDAPEPEAPEPEAPEPEAPAAAKTDEPAAATPDPAKPETAKAAPTEAEKQAAAVEAEIGELQLKEKAAARFRELAARPSEADVAPLRERAARADQWEQIIVASTAKPEQLNSALGYVQAINSGDPAAMGAAFDAMSKELAWLGQQIGREVPGLHDPLAAHADLAREVEDGDLTRARALEIARQRAESQRTTERQRQQAQHDQDEHAHRASVDTAMRQIGELNAQLKASDPAFAQKLPMLQPALDIIRANLPPAQWAQAIAHAWTQLPAVAAPAPKAPVAPMPIRPTGAPSTQARKPANAMEAFEAGLAAAARQ